MGQDPDSTLKLDVADLTSAGGRSAVVEAELLQLLTRQFQAFPECRTVKVVGLTRLDAPDTEGCNWSSSLVLEPGGVAPEVYAPVYAEVVKNARERYNLPE